MRLCSAPKNAPAPARSARSARSAATRSTARTASAASCETAYHPSCLFEFGGCATLGCRLKGELPGGLEHWRCRACHTAIEQTLSRRRCPCGACLHDGCVEAHAEACEQALDLRRPPRDPPTWREPPQTVLPPPPRSGLSPQSSDLLQTLLYVGVILCVTVMYDAFDRAPHHARRLELLAGSLALLLAWVTNQRGEFPTSHGPISEQAAPLRFWLALLTMIVGGLYFVLDAIQSL